MEYSYLTDIGKVRDANEDSVYVSTNRFGDVIAIVADGMGGHNAGDIASKVLINRIGRAWTTAEQFQKVSDAKKWLSVQIKAVNQHILNYANQENTFSGMGTTAVIAIILDDKTIVANVGDSRAYVLYNNDLIKVTTDQTLVNVLLAQGEITELEAKFHPQKNVVMQAVGTSKVLTIDFFELENTYSHLLLCSDGLTNLVSDERIKEVLINNTIDHSVQILVDDANDSGGFDNITVAILEVGE